MLNVLVRIVITELTTGLCRFQHQTQKYSFEVTSVMQPLAPDAEVQF